MPTAEWLAWSVQMDSQGVHLLLWREKDELVRALVVFLASVGDVPTQPILLASADQAAGDLRRIFEAQTPSPAAQTEEGDVLAHKRDHLLVLFLQQATSSTIGPWLNGWRNELAKSPGALLVVRNADYMDFQRNAPDLASYVGPKIYDCVSLLSMWSEKTAANLRPSVPDPYVNVLRELPGEFPSVNEIESWIRHHAPSSDD